MRNTANRASRRPLRTRTHALAAALGAAFCPVAGAQSTSDSADAPTTITVTATRVVRSGFTAPTPTTMLGSDQIAERAQTSLGEILNEQPQFRATLSGASAGPGLRGAQTVPDLRGLGGVRTLVLFDGQRAVPATTTGLTDLNLIPTLLVNRVEVVTGGASAGWGSDAVAGVVNVVLNRRLEGTRADLMIGQSRFGDSSQNRFSLASGAHFQNGRGHIVGGVDIEDNRGVGDQFTRPWGRDNYGVFSNTAGATNGLPQRLVLPNVYVGNATLGGLVTAVGGGAPASLRGTAFGPGGTPYAFPFGSLTSATQTVGANITGAFAAPTNLMLQPPVERINGMVRVSYDLNDNLTAFASVLVATNKSTTYTFPNQTAGATALTIRADNAFLPASIRAQMPAGSTITVGRYTQDGLGAPQSTSRNETVNLAAGLAGELPNNWTWELNAETGSNTLDQTGTNFLVRSNFLQAIDAVTSAGGQIVCRSTLTAPGNGCVPFNIFGNGSPSAAAEAYVRGTETQHQVTKQDAVALTVRGEPFSTWAGKVSLATGAEWRRLSADADVDAISLANGFVPSNPKPLHGSYTVKEVFAETVVPLASKQAWAKAFDFNGAVRYTDYSTSGAVTTWKAGFVYAPSDLIKARFTRSLDIRAPNLNELYSFASGGTSNTLLNPWLGGANAGFVTVLTSGNTDLKPEKSRNLTYGIVLQPTKQLSLSADYYDIVVKDVIATYANQTIINQCFAGNQVLCDLVMRNASNQIQQINQKVINLASFRATGIDFQATYRLRLADLMASVPGDLNLGLSANRTTNAIVDDGVSGPVNRAGDVNIANTFGRPKWLGNLSATYRNKRLSVGAVVRYIGKGNYDNLYAEDVSGTPAPGGFTINTNRVPSVTYLNLNFAYDLFTNPQHTVQLYGVINNALDKDPPPVPAGAGSTNPVFYDVVGRMYKVGLRASF